MKSTNFSLIRYDADEGFVFDWKEPRFIEDQEGNEVQEHLNTKTIFVGPTDSIENYIEVAEDGSYNELTTPDFATENDYLEALAELGVE